VSTPASANGRAPRQRVGRAKIAVLLPSGWLYGTVNRAEFERAVSDPKKHWTFRLSKRGWHASSVVDVLSRQVDAWDWMTPAAPARRKRPTNGVAPAPPALSSSSCTPEQRAEVAEAIRDIDQNTRSMLCVAAGVDSIDHLSQATLPAFKEALAGYMEQAER
jgi:hypothetical protein